MVQPLKALCLGASAIFRRNRQMSSAVARIRAGRIASRRMFLAAAQIRQGDRGGSGGASGSGGKSEDLADEILDQNDADQMRQQPCPRQNRIGGGQFVDPAQGFHAFEADFHLPAVGIPRNDLFRGTAAGGK
jgi:hypothetical protein